MVVPAASEIQTLDDLVAKFKADPRSVSWAGGSAGGTDHILVGLIAEQVGVEPSGVNYIAFSGGGEALAALLANDVTAGVSGLSEFAGQIAARSEEHTSELQSLMRISYAVFCLKTKTHP